MSDKIVQLNEGVCPRNNGSAEGSGEYDGKCAGGSGAKLSAEG